LLSLLNKSAIYYCAKASLCCSKYKVLVSDLASTIAGSLPTSTLASERSTYSVHTIVLVVGTFIVLQMSAIRVLRALNELSLFIDPPSLLSLSLTNNLFCRVGNN
jgi:hypothetical protein